MAWPMILDLASSLDVIHVTAEYSNAVLVAVLPYVSNVVQKLDLPVPQPVTMNLVCHCSINPSRNNGDVGAEIGIKRNWVFQFERGYIRAIQGPHSYFSLQNPDEIPKYFGNVRMTKEEAVQLARNTLWKLGIRYEDVFAEQEPRITGPVKIGTNVVPHYRIEWLEPRAGITASVDMEINGDTRRVEQIHFSNKNLERPPPRINVVPPRDTRFPVWPSANPDYAWRLIPIVLQAIDEYGEKLALPIPRPLKTNHIARFSLTDNGGWPHSELELTNGWRFVYRNNMVNGYYAPDNFFNSGNRPIHIKDFAGKWNVTEQEAIDLVRRTILKLNYPTNLIHMDFKPRVFKPANLGIPRFSIGWYVEREDDLQSKVEVEVDADKGEIKSLYYDDKAYWNHPPKIDVPISLPRSKQTNVSILAPSQTLPTPQPRAFVPFDAPKK
jgi:hypothetical protein